jgi:hypothetical protein
MDPASGGGGDGNSDSDTSVAPSEPETPSPPTEGTASETATSTSTADEPATTVADVTTAAESDSAATTTSTKQPFSWRKARRTLFPIHGPDEVHKFLLIGSIKFFIIMALTLTRDTKDTLVVTQCGAEAIAFLKVSGRKRSCYCLELQNLFLA